MLLTENSNRFGPSVSELKKYRQKKRILLLLYKHNELSAPQIGKKISVSMPTVITLISDLTSSKYIVSKGTGESRGGRKPLLYGLAKDSVYILACDMGRYKTRVTIFNPHNEKVTPIRLINTSIDDPELEEKLFTCYRELIEENGIPDYKIAGIGIDMPGLVDSNKGINHTIKKEELRPVQQRIEKKFNKPVFIDNDARTQAYGEYVFGKAQGKKNAIVINWNWGIGLGMILNGKIYSGTSGFAGEFSHIKMVDNGDLCICGKKGCLETISSANALIRYAAEGIKNNVVTQLSNITESELTVDKIISAAKLGDEFSISILSKIGMALGKGLSYIIQLINPEVIVLSGSLSKANQFVLTPIQQSLNKYCLERISSNSEIVISDLSEDSGLLGIAATMYERIFSD